MSTLPHLRLWLRSSREIPHQALVGRGAPKDGHGAWVVRKKMGCWKEVEVVFTYGMFGKISISLGEFAWFFMGFACCVHAILSGSSWEHTLLHGIQSVFFYGKTCVERDSSQILHGQKNEKMLFIEFHVKTLSIWMSNEKHGIKGFKGIRAYRVLT